MTSNLQIGKKNFEDEEETLISNTKSIDFNVVQEEIGSLGRYQMFLILVVYLAAIPAGLNMVGSVFLEATPDHRCALPPLDNHPNLYPNLTEEKLKNCTIPFDSSMHTYEQCSRYNYSLSSCDPGKLNCITPYPPKPPLVVAIPCDSGYRYNKTIYKNTVVSEWNLVCSDSILKAVADSVFFMGIFVGALLGGSLADRFGRVPTLLISQIGIVAFGIACAYSPTLTAYIILRFVLAIFVQAGYLISFVYVMEITGSKWRTLVGINVQSMFTVGECLLSLFATLWKDWRDMQLYMSLFPLLLCCLCIFVPESPRWLFSKGKFLKGKAVSEKIAKRNGYVVSHDLWERAEAEGRKMEIATDTKHYSPLELFKRPQMKIITMVLLILWFVASLVYYGLALNIGTLSGNVYLNNALNALVEPVGYVMVVLTMDRLGRKALTAGTFLFGGIFCLTSTFVKDFSTQTQSVTISVTAISLLGKMCIACSFSIMTNYTSELYPTVVRSTGVGIGSMAARVGGSITPFALYLQQLITWLPGAIFGAASILAAIMTLKLPETLHIPMMTSLEEAESFYTKRTKNNVLIKDFKIGSSSDA